MIRLKELREENGWSMKEAAKFLNKPYTTYVNHEKMIREPSSEDLKSYANAYKVSIDYLIGRTDEKNPATQSDGSDEISIHVEEIMKLLPFEGKIQLAAFAQKLKVQYQSQDTQKESV